MQFNIRTFNAFRCAGFTMRESRELVYQGYKAGSTVGRGLCKKRRLEIESWLNLHPEWDRQRAMFQAANTVFSSGIDPVEPTVRIMPILIDDRTF